MVDEDSISSSNCKYHFNGASSQIYSTTFSMGTVAGTSYACWTYSLPAYLSAGHAVGFSIVSNTPIDFDFFAGSDYNNWKKTCNSVPGALIVQKSIQSYDSTATSDGLFNVNQDGNFYCVFINSSPAKAIVTFNISELSIDVGRRYT